MLMAADLRRMWPNGHLSKVYSTCRWQTSQSLFGIMEVGTWVDVRSFFGSKLAQMRSRENRLTKTFTQTNHKSRKWSSGKANKIKIVQCFCLSKMKG
jgi:hypothetical protein